MTAVRMDRTAEFLVALKNAGQATNDDVRRGAIGSLITRIGAVESIIPDHVARLSRLRADLARLIGIRGAIGQMIEDAPDHLRGADALASTRAWARANELRASIQVLERAADNTCDYFLGRPLLPTPIRELCSEMDWPGSIPTMAAAIEKMSATIKTHEDQCEALIAEAITLLGKD